MYRYDGFDREIVNRRVAQFRDQTRRFLAGELTEDEFRPLRLKNGLYIQKHAPMLRIAIPYGMLSSKQLRTLAHIARTYDRGYGHFTTRQNIQFNWPEMPQVPDILAELAAVEMHAIQTSGNCVRNITSDPFAGVAADEIVDTRPWCELMRQWSTLHPEFEYLPRKFKIAVSGSVEDRASVQVHDIGVHVVRDDAGEIGFRVLVGGGQGRTPMLGHVIREFLPAKEVLNYFEAILRVYNRFGRRDNKYKARIKIQVKEVGVERFTREVEQEWAQLRGGPGTVPEGEIERLSAHFTRPEYTRYEREPVAYRAALADSRPFARWVGRNVRVHRERGYAIVTISLKRPGVAPGDATAEQMDAIADLAERYSGGELRVTHEQNLVLADVRQIDLHRLWRALDRLGLARRLLLARQREVDPDRRGDPAAVRRSRLRARPGRPRAQHVGLHERVRPSSRRQHRHPRRRQERQRVVPDLDRRRAGQRGVARQGDRPVVRRGRCAGCDRAPCRRLCRAQASRRGFHRHGAPPRHRSVQGARICRNSFVTARSRMIALRCCARRSRSPTFPMALRRSCRSRFGWSGARR